MDNSQGYLRSRTMIVMGISSRSRRRAARWAGVVVVLVVGLSGCSSGASLAVGRLPSHTTSASALASATPSPTKVLSPQDEAVATVRRFFEALTAASTTGNTAPVRTLIDPRCSCLPVLEMLRHDFSDGRRDVGCRWTLARAAFAELDGKYAFVDASYSVTAYRTIRADGSTEASFPSRSRSGFIQLIRAGDRWLVLELRGDKTS